MLSVAKRPLLGALCFILAFALCGSSLFAAATGQIKGRLTDQETKEGIVGASVRIEGTTIGAQSDPDGNYLISRVEPGTYTLTISSVEYNTVSVKNVTVTADKTTEVNATSVKRVTDLDIKIDVTAKIDIVDKFATSNQATVTAQEIKARPVQTVDNLLTQVAGVQTNATGQVFIRGGRAGEVSYIVDGVPINDPLGGLGEGAGANLSLTSGSIQEIQIIKDGFDPEYGNALSGIVKVTSQTGNKDNTKVSMQYLTDDLGTNKLNNYSRNYDYTRFTVSGPDPILRSKILPALGLKFLEDKEITYYLYGEVEKYNGVYQYERYDSPSTRRRFNDFSILGIGVPERLFNRYNIQSNLKFRPRQNLNMILSYKMSDIRRTLFKWDYRYTASNAPVYRDYWNSVSLEVSQEISKNMNYEAVFSYYAKKITQMPGDPNNPGRGLSPDEFKFDSEWETFTDRNGNKVYDPPEPLINVYPDSANYGNEFNGPAYTFGEFFFDQNLQGNAANPTTFRFNNNQFRDSLEGEAFIDLNGNGVWDQGDYLDDKNGNGRLDADRVSPINIREPEAYIDGDSVIGEPFTDINANGKYDPGIDIFIRSANPNDNMDLNYNGRYDGPRSNWEQGIPYVDRNGNGIYDTPNNQFDPGEAYTDRNGNNSYDYGGTGTFLNPGAYDEDAQWHRHETKTLRGEVKVFRQLGAHQLKGGVAMSRDDFSYEDIQRPYLRYDGRPDGGAYPSRGEFRDFFKYKPISGTVYLRDMIEYGSMIAMLGLRWDFFLQDTGPLVDVVRNDDLGAGNILGDRQRLSPRIGFSYPISDKAKVHFNYGHFFQLPDYVWLYARNTASVNSNDVVGNYNLDYQKTVQYSFGVKYAMTENYSVDLSGYFKDEFDKINSKSVTEGRRRFQKYVNGDYGRSRGFEVTLEKRGGGYVNGQLSYTYAFAYGKASQTNTNYLSDFLISREPLSEAPLDNDIRHSLKAGIQIYLPKSVKPRLFGLAIPNGWSTSIESVIESGKPFTPDKSYPNIVSGLNESIERNSLRYPATAVFDVRFSKEFQMVGIDYNFIIWVENIFNSRNVVTLNTKTGRADTQQNQDQVIKGGTAYDQNPANWDYGRQVRVGLEVAL